MRIERLQYLPARGLTRFNGFELLAWDFNPRWAERSSIRTQIEFASSIISFAGVYAVTIASPH
jgi:hypothetical protein